MTKRTVTLIEGDGIGPEIAAATIRAVEAAGGQLEWLVPALHVVHLTPGVPVTLDP